MTMLMIRRVVDGCHVIGDFGKIVARLPDAPSAEKFVSDHYLACGFNGAIGIPRTARPSKADLAREILTVIAGRADDDRVRFLCARNTAEQLEETLARLKDGGREP